MILLTGGSGLLGRHLFRLLDCYAPSHSDFDIESPALQEHFSYVKERAGISLIVHCAAYTDVDRAEVERSKAYMVNVLGTLKLAELGVPLVYISTEYVFDGAKGNYSEEDETSPVNCYARTKELGEKMAKHAPRWLIVRTLFKPRPFEHERAVIDQWTSGDYVDVIAPLIAKAVKLFAAGKLKGIIHIGTGRKSTYDLAKQSRDVTPITRSDISVPLPMDTSLNTRLWERLSA